MKSLIHTILPLLGMALAGPLAQAGSPPAGDVVRDAESVAFLGVETTSMSPTLTAQLGLPEDTGLVVEQVVPDSAAGAALKRHDILLKFEDQMLIEPRQLAVLVRGHKPGDSVTVTYLRTGKQETATLKLGKHEAPKMADWGHDGPGNMHFQFQDHGFSRDDMDRMLSLMNNPPVPPMPPGPPTQLFPHAPAPPDLNEVSVDVANSNIVYTDDTGTLTLTIKDGKKNLVACDAQGKPLFSGPIDTREQRNALPPEVKARVDKLQGMKEFRFRTDRDFHGGQSRILQPEGERMALPLAPAQARQPSF